MGESDVALRVRALSRRLLPEADAFGRRMAERIRAEVPVYGEEELVTSDELVAACSQNLQDVLGILAGDSSTSLVSSRVTGAARAAQGVPYDAVLLASRTGGRFIWELLVEHAGPDEREVLLLAAADIWSVIDDLADVLTDSYRQTSADRARRNGRMRAAMVGALLKGDEPAEQIAEAARVLEFDGANDFVVVSAESPSPGAEGLPEVERVLRRSEVASAWRHDSRHQDGVVALRIGFGIFDLAAALEEVAAARVGLSRPFGSLERAADGWRQARAACAAGSSGSADVVRYDERPLGVLLAGSPEQARSMVDSVLGEVFDLPSEERAVLLETARAWLAAGGSAPAAARAMNVHRNIVRYRIRKLEEVTGRDLTRPTDAAEVFVALECVRILGLG